MCVCVCVLITYDIQKKPPSFYRVPQHPNEAANERKIAMNV